MPEEPAKLDEPAGAKPPGEDRTLDANPCKPPGHGLRWAVGIVILALAVPLLILALLPPVKREIKSATRAGCKNNLRQIGIALTLYADDNGGAFPADFLQLYRSNWADDPKIFSCPAKPSRHEDFESGTVTDRSSSYVYVPGLGPAMSGVILAYDKSPDNHRKGSRVAGRNVLFADGTVVWWPAEQEAELQQRLELQNEAVQKWRRSGKPADAFGAFADPKLRQMMGSGGEPKPNAPVK